MSAFPKAGPAARAAAYERQQASMVARNEDTTRRIDELIAEADGDRRDFWIDYQQDRLERLAT